MMLRYCALLAAAAALLSAHPASAQSRRTHHRYTTRRSAAHRAPRTRASARSAVRRYVSPGGWSIEFPASWRVFDESVSPARTTVFFAPSLDSVERLVVAALPASSATSEQLRDEVAMDAPTQYDVYTEIGRGHTTVAGLPGGWLQFRGTRQGIAVPVRSYSLAVLRGHTGYVINARTAARDFETRFAYLLPFVRSFRFTRRAVDVGQTPR